MNERAGPEIVLDLSRLLSRVLHPTPTGVDRCEMAYARGLLALEPERLAFAAVHPWFGYGRLRREAVLCFLDRTERRWAEEGDVPAAILRRDAARSLLALRPRRTPPRDGERVYLQASPNNLTKPGLIRRILTREQARFVCLVHDLIPIEYPEYARPGGAGQHRVRIETVCALADGIVCNSHATLASLKPWIERSGRRPNTAVAHLGVDLPAVPPNRRIDPEGRPYFVCIGTIEPRKNHLLLLNIWRQMAAQRGAAAIPKLVLIGRRGWENEQVVDMLERCPALAGCVEEHGRLPDRDVWRQLAGARALVMPSFAEGYGMPVAEALHLGVPVICSDLAALREVGGGAAVFLDPLDGPAWLEAIDAAAAPVPSARPDRTTSWADHLAIVVDLLRR